MGIVRKITHFVETFQIEGAPGGRIGSYEGRLALRVRTLPTVSPLFDSFEGG